MTVAHCLFSSWAIRSHLSLLHSKRLDPPTSSFAKWRAPSSAKPGLCEAPPYSWFTSVATVQLTAHIQASAQREQKALLAKITSSSAADEEGLR